MEFLQAISNSFLKKPLHIKGRAPRAEFWYSFLLLLIIQLIACFFVLSISSLYDDIWYWLTWAMVGFMLALTIRRLHDVNRSGLLIIFPVVPIVLSVIADYYYEGLSKVIDESTLDMLLVPISIVAWVVTLYIFGLMFCEGTIGPNKYGPDPYEGQRLIPYSDDNLMGYQNNSVIKKHFDFDMAHELFDEEQLRAPKKLHVYSNSQIHH